MSDPSSSKDAGCETSRRGFLRAASAGTAAAATGASVSLPAADVPNKLPMRELGKTGVQVPVLGIGTAPAGHRSRKEAADLFSHCLDIGANYMDTAPTFAGYGIAQAALGDVLKSRRNEAFLVTKCWEPDGEKALKLLKSNLAELQTDHADLVYAHSIGSDKMDPATVLGPDGTMRALLKAQQDGLTRFIGISGHNRPQRFLDVLKDFDVQVMMTAVSFVSRHIYNFEETVWPTAHERGVGLVAMKVYGGGTKKSGSRMRPAELLNAFRYAQSLPNISTVVIGVRDREELDANIRFARTYQKLSDQEMANLIDKGRQLAKIWGEPYGPVS